MRMPLLFSLLMVIGAAPAARAQAAPPQESFREQVESTVARGVAWLKAQQKPDGTFGITTGMTYAGGSDAYPNIIGITAFSLYTLLKCGVEVRDPVIQKGFKYILDHYDDHPQSTYEIAACIFAWEEKVRVKPKQKKNESEIDYKKRALLESKYNMDRSDQSILKKLTRDLVAMQDQQDGQPGRGWRYGNNAAIQAAAQAGAGAGGGGNVTLWGNTGGNCDVSATQYALLGLKAASRLGLRGDIKDDVFFDALQFLLGQQETKGPPVKRENHDSDLRRTFVAGAGDLARGWSYMKWYTQVPKEATTTGSMTTAGVCGVIICKSELARHAPFVRDRALMEKTDKAVRDGLGWCINYYSMAKNPRANWEGDASGPALMIGGDHYYYLYGMERMGVLGDVDKIDKHDWYVDGARDVLLPQQKKVGEDQGYWKSGQTHEPSDVFDTCFALLFLEKASVPIPGGAVITGGGR